MTARAFVSVHALLGGDSCHDKRLLTGQKQVATWSDPSYPGVVCCIHKDKARAEETIAAIRRMQLEPGDLNEVEVVVLAHDGAWEKKAREEGRCLPGSL